MSLYLKSTVLEKVPGIVHGFGTQQEPVPSIFSKYWDHRPKWKQVHGVAAANVQSPMQECGEVDSLFTEKVQIPIGVVTADCVPVLLAHQSGKKVAAVHAGWRGTYAHILEKLWMQLEREGEKANEWVAAIGPAIGSCCYEVSQELADQFVKEFSFFDQTRFLPKPRYLDLPALNAEVLKKIGIQEVDVLHYCTRCSQNPSFHSYRREGGGSRQLSILMKL
jgi:YfiH family protein